MGNIIPRWEWRTFSVGLSAAAARLADLEPIGIQESDDIYLLSPLCDANVKIRDGLIDVKRLEQTNSAGLEQWRPVLKASFPLPAETVGQIYQVLGLASPQLARASYARDELLNEVVATDSKLKALSTHKIRTRYRIGGCSAELTEVTLAGQSVQTFAVESEDPAAVTGVLQGLDLSQVPNQNYARWLNAAVGMNTHFADALYTTSPARYAAIDVGTNSVKLHIGDRDADGHWHRVLDRVEVTKLGERLYETGIIQKKAQERTIAAINKMTAEAEEVGARKIVAVGTMGLRSALNRDEVLQAVRAATGLSIEVIDGEEEARLAYRAVEQGLGLPQGTIVVFDTGGGSTQVTRGRCGKVLERFSLNIGAVRLTEQFGLAGAVNQQTLHAVLADVADELRRLDEDLPPDILVGMGGTVTNLAAVNLGMAHYDPNRIHGATLTRTQVTEQIHEYSVKDASQRREILGLQPGRADIILAGACIVLTLMNKLRQDRLVVSEQALRHGILIERFPSLTSENVRFGSKADIRECAADVRFIPKSGNSN